MINFSYLSDVEIKLILEAHADMIEITKECQLAIEDAISIAMENGVAWELEFYLDGHIKRKMTHNKISNKHKYGDLKYLILDLQYEYFYNLREWALNLNKAIIKNK